MYKNITDYKAHQENPFLKEAINEIESNRVRKNILVNSHSKTEIKMVINQDGDVDGYTNFMKIIEVDEQKFAKVYLSGFYKFFDITQAGIRVFGFIINSIKPNGDQFLFDIDECMVYTKYKSNRSVINGLASLLEVGIIARSEKSYKYFINPLVVFNGNRVTFAQSYIKRSKDSQPGIDL